MDGLENRGRKKDPNFSSDLSIQSQGLELRKTCNESDVQKI